MSHGTKARVSSEQSSRTQRASWRGQQNRWGALLALPFFLGFLFVFVLPIGYAVGQSLFTVQADGGLGLGGSTVEFAALDNYVRVFRDNGFWAAMVRVAVFAVIQIPISLCLSLTAALLLDGVIKEGRSTTFRFLLLVPYMVPAIVASLIWVYLYSPQVGPFTALGDLVGADINLFGPNLLWIAIGNLILWMSLGFNMLIIYSALRGLDRSILEAATVDGAGALRIAWSIKIPQVQGTLVLTGLLSIIGMLQIFNEPLLFRSASPDTVTQDFTPIMAIYFEAFTSNNYNYAAALSVVLAVVVGICSYLFYKFSNRKASS